MGAPSTRQVIGPQDGLGLHGHPEGDEAIYVIEGTMAHTTWPSGKAAPNTERVAAGGGVYLKKGRLHRTWNAAAAGNLEVLVMGAKLAPMVSASHAHRRTCAARCL